MQPLRHAGHLTQDAIEHDGEHASERKGGQPSGPDQQRRFAEQVGRDAAPAEPERAQRGHFTEALVHRHRQQRGDEQEREGQRHRREHDRDLAEVAERVLIELFDHLSVRIDAEVRAQCRDGGRGRRRPDVGSRGGQHQVGLVGVRDAVRRRVIRFIVVATVKSSVASNLKPPMPTTRPSVGGSADAVPGRITRISQRRARLELEPCGQLRADNQRRRATGRRVARQRRSFLNVPDPANRAFGGADKGHVDAAPFRGRPPIATAPPARTSATRSTSGNLPMAAASAAAAGDGLAVDHRALGGHDANVEAGRVEQDRGRTRAGHATASAW